MTDEQKAALLGLLIDTKEYEEFKEYGYDSLKLQYPDLDIRAVGVYWFIMGMDILEFCGASLEMLLEGVEAFYSDEEDEEAVH
jgi:hypothetical protein